MWVERNHNGLAAKARDDRLGVIQIAITITRELDLDEVIFGCSNQCQLRSLANPVQQVAVRQRSDPHINRAVSCPNLVIQGLNKNRRFDLREVSQRHEAIAIAQFKPRNAGIGIGPNDASQLRAAGHFAQDNTAGHCWLVANIGFSHREENLRFGKVVGLRRNRGRSIIGAQIIRNE